VKALRMTVVLREAYTSGEPCTDASIPYELALAQSFCISVEDDPYAINQGWDSLAESARAFLRELDPGGFSA